MCIPSYNNLRAVLLHFFMYGQEGLKLEINVALQQIFAKSKGGAYNRRGCNFE